MTPITALLSYPFVCGALPAPAVVQHLTELAIA